MKKSIFLAGFIGILVGSLITYFILRKPFQNSIESQDQHDMTKMIHQEMTMDEMVTSLKGNSGDEFDKLFLVKMIEHHQGAIDMAELASSSAKHEKLKKMAYEIISAQTKEIEQMKNWQDEWKY